MYEFVFLGFLIQCKNINIRFFRSYNAYSILSLEIFDGWLKRKHNSLKKESCIISRDQQQYQNGRKRILKLKL